MSGSSRGLEISMFSGLRVASLEYWMAHNKNGKNISAKLNINAYLNRVGRDGVSRRSLFTFACWGKLADAMAKCLKKGQEFNVTARCDEFQKTVFHNRQPVQMSDGTILKVRSYSWTIQDITLGPDSDKTINDEIGAGTRPADWAVAGSPGYVAWRQHVKQLMTEQPNPNTTRVDAEGRKLFGNAVLRIPTGPGISAYTSAPTAPQATTAAPAASPAPAQVATQVYTATAPNVAGAGQVVTPQVAPNVAPAQGVSI